MSERHTALLFFQKDIEEAVQLFREKTGRFQSASKLYTRVFAGTIIFWLEPTTGPSNIDTCKLLQTNDLAEAIGLLIEKRKLPIIQGGYWMRIAMHNPLGSEAEIAAIPHSWKILEP